MIYTKQGDELNKKYIYAGMLSLIAFAIYATEDFFVHQPTVGNVGLFLVMILLPVIPVVFAFRGYKPKFKEETPSFFAVLTIGMHTAFSLVCVLIMYNLYKGTPVTVDNLSLYIYIQIRYLVISTILNVASALWDDINPTGIAYLPKKKKK